MATLTFTCHHPHPELPTMEASPGQGGLFWALAGCVSSVHPTDALVIPSVMLTVRVLNIPKELCGLLKFPLLNSVWIFIFSLLI